MGCADQALVGGEGNEEEHQGGGGKCNQHDDRQDIKRRKFHDACQRLITLVGVHVSTESKRESVKADYYQLHIQTTPFESAAARQATHKNKIKTTQA